MLLKDHNGRGCLIRRLLLCVSVSHWTFHSLGPSVSVRHAHVWGDCRQSMSDGCIVNRVLSASPLCCVGVAAPPFWRRNPLSNDGKRFGSLLSYYLTCFLYYTCLWLQSWTSSTAGASAQQTTVDDLSLSKSLWNELDMISSAISSGRLSPINTKRGGREWRKSFIFDEEQCSKMKAGFGAYAVIGSTFSQQEQ